MIITTSTLFSLYENATLDNLICDLQIFTTVNAIICSNKEKLFEILIPLLFHTQLFPTFGNVLITNDAFQPNLALIGSDNDLSLVWCHSIICANIKYKDYVYGRCYYKSSWKNKEYSRMWNRKMIWCIKTYIIAYFKTQRNKIYYPLCQTYSLTVV